MPKSLNLAFVTEDVNEIEAVLNAMNYGSITGQLVYMDLNKPKELDRSVDGINVKGQLIKVGVGGQSVFYLGITESDIDELIGEYISDKSGVRFYDMSKSRDNQIVSRILSTVHTHSPTPQQKVQKRKSPTQKKLDAVLKAMPNDTFVQSLDQQYKSKGRLSAKQQSALQKIYDRITNPITPDPKLVARLDALVQAMPRDRFVNSLRDQYNQRGSLSTKQMSALEKLEKGIASGGDKALIQRIDALLSNTLKIKGRKKTLLSSFKEQALNGRRLSQRQLELVSEYEDSVR